MIINPYIFGGLPLLLDIYPNARVAYSLRKINSTYTGDAIAVRRSSDNTSQNIGFDSNGNLDTTSLLSFVGAGNGFVSIWYDQSGNATNLSQVASANQPQIVSGGALITRSGKPYLTFNTTQWLSLPTLMEFTTTPCSMWMTYEKSAYGQNLVIGSDTGTQYMYLDYGSTQRLGQSAGLDITITPALSIDTRYIINGLTTIANTGGNNLSSTLYINNSLKGTSSTSYTYSANYASTNAFPSSIGAVLSFLRPGTITTNEWILYPTNQSTNRTGIESNINSFYTIY